MRKPDTHALMLDRDGVTYRPGARYPSIIKGDGHSEAIKGSLRRDIIVEGFKVVSGTEDCLDFVRGRNITLKDLRLIIPEGTSTNQFVTVKGGVFGTKFIDVELVGEPKGWFPLGPAKVFRPDIVLGDHTIYDYDRHRPQTRETSLRNVWHRSGRKVNVLCHHAQIPVEYDRSQVNITVMPPWLTRLRFAFLRFVMKLTKTVPPDAQLEIKPWELT